MSTESKYLPIDRIIWRILNDNHMDIKLTNDALAKMLSKRLGTKVWTYYITRWKRGSISVKYKKVLLEVYNELVD